MPSLPTATSPSRHPKRLVVVGDALLDRDWSGSVDRLSPEAPVPVVGHLELVSRPGGAALAAVMAARSGGDVTLVTALAADQAGEELRAMLEAARVTLVDLRLGGPTPVKTRIRAAGRTLLVLDEGDGPSPQIRDGDDALHAVLDAADGVLVADYGRGLAALPHVRALLGRLARTTPVVWDPHPRGASPVPGVWLATPNSREAAHFAQAADTRGLRGDVATARLLVTRWGAARVAVTRGPLGAVLVEDDHGTPLVVSAPKQLATDACGAGDRFAVAVTALLANGALPSLAVTEAVTAATQYVEAGGPASLQAREPDPARGGPEREDPHEVVERVRARGGTVVATGGCFDLLHTGHIQMLETARALGDCLIVCLNGDASVARIKGPSRPIVTAEDRARMLLALRSVDAVLVFDEDTPVDALRSLQPDIFVKGADYSTFDLPETAAMREWGGEVVVVPYLAGRSTAQVLDAARGTP